ncbi:MAG TPA: hypothetical protein RMH26_15355, partial [Polyangiaceae bacterium LLY-WYZ-15_(1-7)]|nr:hypothetical protein [Polyangiaceae bacterium LLY-WYZ-15_(1-7)]
ETASLGFEPPPGTGTGISWADEAIRAPTLLGTGEPGSEQWHVMVEGTNDQPELELSVRVGYAIGHAFEDVDRWNTDEWSDSSGVPRLGAQPPSCADMSCPGEPPATSYREPYLFETEDGSRFVAFAVELGEASEVFGLAYAEADGLGRIASSFMLLEPGDVAALSEDGASCRSLRDPAIVPRAGMGGRYWLFFTCETEGGSTIRAQALRSNLGPLEPDESVEGVEVLPGGLELGEFARDGVYGPELIVDPQRGEVNPVFRLWFLGRSNLAGASVGLAVGQAKGAASELPDFQAYPANPVLRPTDRALRSCAECTIQGFAVARHPDDVGALRFLFGLRVPEADGRRYELLPLDQPWRPEAAE